MLGGLPKVGFVVLPVGDKSDDPLAIGLASGKADSSAARSWRGRLDAGTPTELDAGTLTELDAGNADSSAANTGEAESSDSRSDCVPFCGGPCAAAASAAAASAALKD